MTSSVIECLSLPNSGSCTDKGNNITCTFSDSQYFLFTDTINKCKINESQLICEHNITETNIFTYLSTLTMNCSKYSTNNGIITYKCESSQSTPGSLSFFYGPFSPIFNCQISSPVSGGLNTVTCLCTTSNIEQPSGPSSSSFSGITGPINVICDSNNIRVLRGKNSMQSRLISAPYLASPYLISPFMTPPYLVSPYFASPYVSSPYFSSPYLASPFFTSKCMNNCMNRR